MSSRTARWRSRSAIRAGFRRQHRDQPYRPCRRGHCGLHGVLREPEPSHGGGHEPPEQPDTPRGPRTQAEAMTPSLRRTWRTHPLCHPWYNAVLTIIVTAGLPCCRPALAMGRREGPGPRRRPSAVHRFGRGLLGGGRDALAGHHFRLFSAHGSLADHRVLALIAYRRRFFSRLPTGAGAIGLALRRHVGRGRRPAWRGFWRLAGDPYPTVERADADASAGLGRKPDRISVRTVAGPCATIGIYGAPIGRGSLYRIDARHALGHRAVHGLGRVAAGVSTAIRSRQNCPGKSRHRVLRRGLRGRSHPRRSQRHPAGAIRSRDKPPPQLLAYADQGHPALKRCRFRFRLCSIPFSISSKARPSFRSSGFLILPARQS